ncbi:hypothetical protein [Microcoleus sp. bin38.metabat.b11b12b14.051]|uniref:hypothetical protein n=1 Tax=Microcoleus sp. bin38.metabat.b11b12b14.051 TaxID=2742709 RepID=UPI0025D6DCBD|nr:hypothetical protein [Microcoleus sp. bin38.metabat.b11b12b14.051]
MKVLSQTPDELTIQTSSIWDGWRLISPFIIIGLLQIIFASNWIGGGIFLLFSLCLSDGAISEIYIFDRTLCKMTAKRRSLSRGDVTERSNRDICAVELGEIEDSEGNSSYYVELLMLGCDRIYLRSNSVTEKCEIADLIRTYVSTSDRRNQAIFLPSKCTGGLVK